MSRKGASGVKRSGGGSVAATETQNTKATGQTTVVGTIREGAFDADNPKALDEIRAMAARGEIPERVTGSREAQARLYEEIDKLYAEPTGILADYTVNRDSRNNIELDYQNFARGEEPRIKVPRTYKASEAEVQGAIKQGVYSNRPYVESMYIWRRGRGGYWEDKGGTSAWHGKVFSSQERTALERDWERGILKTFGSPMMPKTREYIKSMWVKDGDGWHMER